MKWTPQDRAVLKTLSKTQSDADLSVFFGVSQPAIRRARQRFAPDSVTRRERLAVCEAVKVPEVFPMDHNGETVWIGPDGLPRKWNGHEWAVCTSPGPIGQVGPIGCSGAETSGYIDAEVVGPAGAVGPVGGCCGGCPVGEPGEPGPAGSDVDPLIEKAKTVPTEFGHIPLDVFDGDAWTKIGLVSDTHLCCREERLDALNAQYDLFVREGVRDVFHAGNIVDGYLPRINGASVLETSIDGQALYCAHHYPVRAGITTHFITGDDHEGWWQKEGFNFGAYLQMVAERLGRKDLKYIGHVEADVELRCGEFVNRMKIQHPGGGSAYARSYKGQKMVESFQGGEKPAILVQGHYHVSGYSFDRNVHIVGMPGFKDQDMFTRKQHLRCEIGGVILEFKMSSVTGAITRIRPEYNMFFDRGFYKKFLPSDGVLRGDPTVVKCGK